MPRGRPPTRKYPPRIDATPEQVAHVVLNAKPRPFTGPREYHCVACGREVSYPEILYRDGRGECCHTAAP